MHIVIMGCGRVGSMLARGLERRGHSVAVIDVTVEAFRRLGSDFQGITVKGVGFDREVLEAADIRHADGFAAVSSGDNSNILAARVVREQYGVDNVVARIYDQGRAAVYERLGIPTVATVRWTVGQVMRRLLPEGSEPVWRDPSGTVRLLQVHVHHGWVGQRVHALSQAAQAPIPFLSRTGRGIVPDSETRFQDGDLIFVACETERTDAVESLFAAPPARN
ncbi:TrkA family potassium uptake protein [Arachnia propionica]|uniref:TrkA family potassium uptake protein n=1 Tax=Arachnia propionica TaxID=1750 RepID=A0A3P1X0B2_9ACTN|nr:TrkA family potassium uptake protein [Arachnia propionica]RRD51130.1 TrkA family potassium uptake protein [Arachnia propionica]